MVPRIIQTAPSPLEEKPDINSSTTITNDLYSNDKKNDKEISQMESVL